MLSYRSVMTQYGDNHYDGQPGDADQFLLGGTRFNSERTMEVGVAWTIDVKTFVYFGLWHLVPLLAIDHEEMLSATQKAVCNKAEFSALVAERYPGQLRTVEEYEEERAIWSDEENIGYGLVESDEDAGLMEDWVSGPDMPDFYDPDEDYFDL